MALLLALWFNPALQDVAIDILLSIGSMMLSGAIALTRSLTAQRAELPRLLS